MDIEFLLVMLQAAKPLTLIVTHSGEPPRMPGAEPPQAGG
jgi:hypothetical protein